MPCCISVFLKNLLDVFEKKERKTEATLLKNDITELAKGKGLGKQGSRGALGGMELLNVERSHLERPRYWCLVTFKAVRRARAPMGLALLGPSSIAPGSLRR